MSVSSGRRSARWSEMSGTVQLHAGTSARAGRSRGVIHLVWLVGLFIASCAMLTDAQDSQRDWSSPERWRIDPSTSALFAFLRQHLSISYIARHFELVEVYQSAALPRVVTVSFRLHYGDELAFTTSASGDPRKPEFISGKARVVAGEVETYAGPLAEYAINISKDKAKEMLGAQEVTIITIPGARRGSDLELWIQDYYHQSDPLPMRLGIFWIGGITSEASMEWHWIGAQDGAAKITPRLLPH